jgi:hypothetical protein
MRETTMELATEMHTMTLDQSALLELLDAPGKSRQPRPGQEAPPLMPSTGSTHCFGIAESR